ncbi:hypothetical protein AVEN_225720-1 [Araneus ventricosus]|uniref:Uncharacterized protein n=1 Tax=Araneus ventricosus TaxID=182803 RepID=A0A4Y2PCU9_ARAVE|nr:hypothetical protein AVEN_225720-1 [Araneus ventricosus]
MTREYQVKIKLAANLRAIWGENRYANDPSLVPMRITTHPAVVLKSGSGPYINRRIVEDYKRDDHIPTRGELQLIDAPFCPPGRSFGVCTQNMFDAVVTSWYPRAAYRVWSDQEDDEEIGSKDRAASTRGYHSDSFHDTIRCRGASCFTNQFQTPCGSKSSIQAPCLCTAFNTETSTTPSTMVPCQSDVE